MLRRLRHRPTSTPYQPTLSHVSFLFDILEANLKHKGPGLAGGLSHDTLFVSQTAFFLFLIIFFFLLFFYFFPFFFLRLDRWMQIHFEIRTPDDNVDLENSYRHRSSWEYSISCESNIISNCLLFSSPSHLAPL